MLAACSSSDDDSDGDSDSGGGSVAGTTPDAMANMSLLQGLQAGATVGSVPETTGNLETALNANDAISIVAQVDHQANASSVELELRPTSVTLFGNPLLGTPLMQINQLAGLDLPQKMFAWTDAEGQSNIAYNSPVYLRGRHGLNEAQATLDTIDGALQALASNAGGQEFVPAVVTAPGLGEGIIVTPSENDMDTTYNNLRSAIDAAAPLRLVAEVDHSANAANVGLELLPTRLIIFGNPNLGTPLMQEGQSIGIDLPQKMLVFQNEQGQVSIAYNCLLYTSPSPRDQRGSRMPSSA